MGGLTPNREDADSRRDLRDDDGCNLVGDNRLGLAVVDADRLEGARADGLLDVGHAVTVNSLDGRRYRNGLLCGTRSCTHAPQAAVNDTQQAANTVNTNT